MFFALGVDGCPLADGRALVDGCPLDVEAELDYVMPSINVMRVGMSHTARQPCRRGNT